MIPLGWWGLLVKISDEKASQKPPYSQRTSIHLGCVTDSYIFAQNVEKLGFLCDILVFGSITYAVKNSGEKPDDHHLEDGVYKPADEGNESRQNQAAEHNQLATQNV